MAFEMVSRISRGIGVLDRGGDRRKEGAVLGVNVHRTSHCNQRELCGVFSAVRGGDAALPKLLWDFLLLSSTST